MLLVPGPEQSLCTPCKVDTVTSTGDEKIEFRKAKRPAQSHTAKKKQSWI